MQLERRVTRFHRTEQILVPRDGQVRVVSALQQQLVATNGNRLVDLLEDLLEAEDITVRRPDRPVERAEVAARHADVGVVDVAVDDVGDDALGMFPRANRIGKPAEQMRRRMTIELQRFGAVHAPAVENLCGQPIDRQKNSNFRRRGARPRSAA